MFIPMFLPMFLGRGGGGGGPPDPKGRPYDFEVWVSICGLIALFFFLGCLWHNLSAHDTFPIPNELQYWDKTGAILSSVIGFMLAVLVQMALFGFYFAIRTIYRAIARGLRP